MYQLRLTRDAPRRHLVAMKQGTAEGAWHANLHDMQDFHSMCTSALLLLAFSRVGMGSDARTAKLGCAFALPAEDLQGASASRSIECAGPYSVGISGVQTCMASTVAGQNRSVELLHTHAPRHSWAMLSNGDDHLA